MMSSIVIRGCCSLDSLLPFDMYTDRTSQIAGSIPVSTISVKLVNRAHVVISVPCDVAITRIGIRMSVVWHQTVAPLSQKVSIQTCPHNLR